MLGCWGSEFSGFREYRIRGSALYDSVLTCIYGHWILGSGFGVAIEGCSIQGMGIGLWYSLGCLLRVLQRFRKRLEVSELGGSRIIRVCDSVVKR